MAVQHIEAIPRWRMFTFDKQHNERALQPSMMVMIQDASKLEFPGRFDAVWLGPYLVREGTKLFWERWAVTSKIILI